MNRRTLLSFAAVLGVSLATANFSPALALDDLRIIAPASPAAAGTRRRAPCRKSMQSAGAVKAVTVENVPGAGGTVGLAQLAEQESGKANVLMVNGLVMVGAILTNKSAVTLENIDADRAPHRRI